MFRQHLLFNTKTKFSKLPIFNCIITCLWLLMKMLTHALEISLHIAHFLVHYTMMSNWKIRDICLYVWTYICHLVLWPLHYFVCLVVDPISIYHLNGILWFSDLYWHHQFVYPFELGCVWHTWYLQTHWCFTNLRFSIRISSGGKLSWLMHCLS